MKYHEIHLRCYDRENQPGVQPARYRLLLFDGKSDAVSYETQGESIAVCVFYLGFEMVRRFAVGLAA